MNMEQLLICLSLALIAGLLMSRLAKVAHLPAVTSYLVAGLLLGPFFLGRLGLSGWGIGFGSLAQVESYGLITQVALGFIAFVIGNEFRLTTLESMGRQAITVGILQAVVTTALVDLALVVLHLLRPDVISMASAITLGAIAAATAPAATLMVVKQYKANGPLTHLLLMVVAIDAPLGVIVEPLVEIVLSLGLGALAGLMRHDGPLDGFGEERFVAVKEAVRLSLCPQLQNGLAHGVQRMGGQNVVVVGQRKIFARSKGCCRVGVGRNALVFDLFVYDSLILCLIFLHDPRTPACSASDASARQSSPLGAVCPRKESRNSRRYRSGVLYSGVRMEMVGRPQVSAVFPASAARWASSTFLAGR